MTRLLSCSKHLTLIISIFWYVWVCVGTPRAIQIGHYANMCSVASGEKAGFNCYSLHGSHPLMHSPTSHCWQHYSQCCQLTVLPFVRSCSINISPFNRERTVRALFPCVTKEPNHDGQYHKIKCRQTTESTARPQAWKIWISSFSGWLTQGIQVVCGVQGNPKGTHGPVVDLRARKWTMGPSHKIQKGNPMTRAMGNFAWTTFSEIRLVSY